MMESRRIRVDVFQSITSDPAFLIRPDTNTKSPGNNHRLAPTLQLGGGSGWGANLEIWGNFQPKHGENVDTLLGILSWGG